MTIKATCPFLGTTGYAYHSREFFTALNRINWVCVDNWAAGDSSNLTLEQKELLEKSQDQADVNILLGESNHFTYYDREYPHPNVAYNVWESTEQDMNFFRKLMTFDQIWVPSEWQKLYTIAQMKNSGYDDFEKVRVVPEGVNIERFKISKRTYKNTNPFHFLVIGRWEYRKSTYEIIKTFISTFDTNKVRMTLLVDNPFNGVKTEERIKNLLGSIPNNLKIRHHVTDKEYVRLLSYADCFVSLSRSEGWNLPLIEAMATGLPSICMDWGGSTEFAGENPLRIKPACLMDAKWPDGSIMPGQYAEPDLDALRVKMVDVTRCYENYSEEAHKLAQKIHEKFTWDNAARIASENLLDLAKGLKHQPAQLDAREVPRNAKEVSPNRATTELVVVDAWCDTPEKLNILKNFVDRLRTWDFKTLLVTHYPDLPRDIIELFDYYIYDKDNSMGDFYMEVKFNIEDELIVSKLNNPYHALPVLRSLRNAMGFAKSIGYRKIHWFEYDSNVDLGKWFSKNTDLDVAAMISYEEAGYCTDVMSLPTNIDLNIPNTWEEYENWGESVYNQILENKMRNVLNDLEYRTPFRVVALSSADVGHGEDLINRTDKHYVKMKSSKSNNTVMLINMGDKAVTGVVGKDKVIVQPRKYKTIPRNKAVSVKFAEIERIFPSNSKYDEYELYKKGEAKVNKTIEKDKFSVYYIDGVRCQIDGSSNKDYTVEFYDKGADEIIHKDVIKPGYWAKPNREFYTDWKVTAKNKDGDIIYQTDLDFTNKRVFIVLDSKSLGDTLAWFPLVEAFRIRHKCKVIVSTFWNQLFEGNYPELEFVVPGTTVENLEGMYTLGCRDDDSYKHKENWRTVPLQKVGADILGLDLEEELIPVINRFKSGKSPFSKPYVCIAPNSTMQAKYWNCEGGWAAVVAHLKSKGLLVVGLGTEALPNLPIIKRRSDSIEDTISLIGGSEFLIGLGSGLSWLAWALGKPVVMISGFSKPWCEFQTNIHRLVPPEGICNGCFNDDTVPFDRGDWNACPYGNDFECSKSITPEMVIESIEKLI